jgi:hypothetical protein
MSSIPSWFKSRLRERLEKPSEFEDGFFQYSGQNFADARALELFFLRRVLSPRAGRLELTPQVGEIGLMAKIRGPLSRRRAIGPRWLRTRALRRTERRHKRLILSRHGAAILTSLSVFDGKDRSCAYSFRTGYQAGRSAQGRNFAFSALVRNRRSGRKARLREPPREGPESATKPPFH